MDVGNFWKPTRGPAGAPLPERPRSQAPTAPADPIQRVAPRPASNLAVNLAACAGTRRPSIWAGPPWTPDGGSWAPTTLASASNLAINVAALSRHQQDDTLQQESK
jgi:hypothetical protein